MEKMFSDCKPEPEEEKILANKIIEFFALKYSGLKEGYENNPDDFVVNVDFLV